MDYRWGEGSPEWKAAGPGLLKVYSDVVIALRDDLGPPECPHQYSTRYLAVKEIYDDLGTIGLRNPLIVWQIEPGRYLTLVGNQRLTALLAAEWIVVPCRVAPEWRWEHEVLRVHPPEAIIR